VDADSVNARGEKREARSKKEEARSKKKRNHLFFFAARQ
jgi:hypothetical protein